MDSSPVEIDEAALKLPQFELEDIQNVSCVEKYKTGSMFSRNTNSHKYCVKNMVLATAFEAPNDL